MLADIIQLHLSGHRRDKRIPAVPITLLEHIERFGQVDPVIVRSISSGNYEILRHAEIWLAIQRLGRHQVDILVRDDLTHSECAELVNLSSGLDPISEAELFQEQLGVVRQRGDIKALADRYDVSRSHVAHGLRLLDLPEVIKETVRAGVLNRGHAKALLVLTNESDRQRFTRSIVQGKWSVGKTEKEIRNYINKKEPKSEVPTKAPETIRLERQLTEAIGSGVTIDEAHGTLTINYQRNLDVLDGVICRIAGGQLEDFE